MIRTALRLFLSSLPRTTRFHRPSAPSVVFVGWVQIFFVKRCQICYVAYRNFMYWSRYLSTRKSSMTHVFEGLKLSKKPESHGTRH